MNRKVYCRNCKYFENNPCLYCSKKIFKKDINASNIIGEDAGKFESVNELKSFSTNENNECVFYFDKRLFQKIMKFYKYENPKAN